MRAFLLLVVTLSTVVFAQPVPGTWTGYVGGWVKSSARSTWPLYEETTSPCASGERSERTLRVRGRASSE